MTLEYQQEREEALAGAKEKVAEAVELLEELLPETAEELSWIAENIHQEWLTARASFAMCADGEQEERGIF